MGVSVFFRERSSPLDQILDFCVQKISRESGIYQDFRPDSGRSSRIPTEAFRGGRIIMTESTNTDPGVDLGQLQRRALIDQQSAAELRLFRRLGPAPVEPYPHSAECRHGDVDPPWTLDAAAECWRRGPCGGHNSCAIVQQRGERALAAPPRPDTAEFEGEHGSLHVELVLEYATGDRWPSWVARCTACHVTKWWRTDAAAHYASLGSPISNRDTGVITVAAWGA